MSKLTGVVLSPIKDKLGELNYTSPFGYREFTYNGKTYKNYHYGIDITTLGTIVSIGDGKVIECRDGITGYDESKSSGNYVTIDHGNGIISMYCHLDNKSVAVKLNDRVKKGDKLGTDIIKTTGFSTGLHCHFAIKENSKWVNPVDYLKGIKKLDSNETNDEVYIVKKGDRIFMENNI